MTYIYIKPLRFRVVIYRRLLRSQLVLQLVDVNITIAAASFNTIPTG